MKQSKLSMAYLRFRLKAIHAERQAAIRREQFSRAELERYQLQKLRELIEYCWQNVAFYQRVWTAYGAPRTIATLRDIEKFPITEKQLLIDGLLDGTALSSEFLPLDSSAVEWHKTSGSSGNPFKFPIDNNATVVREGCRLAIRRWYGYEFGMKEAKVWRGSMKSSTFKERLLGLLNRRRRICIYDPEDPRGSALSEQRLRSIIDELCQFDPHFIDGYVSALVLIAKMMDSDSRARLSELRAVTTGAERLSQNDRDLIATAFGVPVLNRYGGTESSVIAHELLDSVDVSGSDQQLYVREDRLIVETVVGSQAVSGPDAVGELVFTDLHNKVMPFIRYRNGDTVKWGVNSGNSTLPFRCLRDIVGRTNDSFKLQDGSVISSHIWQNYFSDQAYISSYQLVQSASGSVEVKVVLKRNLVDTDQYHSLRRKIELALSGCQVNWLEVDAIPTGPSGKLRHAICHVT